MEMFNNNLKYKYDIYLTFYRIYYIYNKQIL